MSNVFVRLNKMEPGSRAELSEAEATEFFHWTSLMPRSPEEIQSALWRYNVRIERSEQLNALIAVKNDKPAGPSPFSHMPAKEFADRQKRWHATGSYGDA